MVQMLEAAGAVVVPDGLDPLAGRLARVIEDVSVEMRDTLRPAASAAPDLPPRVLVDPRLPGLASELRALGIVAQEATDCSPEAAARATVGITSVLAAIAESGTVIVGPGDGAEGLLAVLPPHHIAILPVGVIEPDLQHALGHISSEISKAGAKVVLVTGPSRTSDIEVTPVMGVHGPLTVHVVMVDEGDRD